MNVEKVLHKILNKIGHFFQQSPMTYISDTVAPLSTVIFPSVTICNINQVKKSILEKSSLPSPKHQDYLIDYFYLGANLSETPEDWNQTLENMIKNTGWNTSLESFNKFAAQEYRI